MERYVKRLEAFAQRQREKASIVPDAVHDHITTEENLALYDILHQKLTNTVFANCPGSENIAKVLKTGRERFISLATEEQITSLLNLVAWFGSAQTCDLHLIGGGTEIGEKKMNSRLAAWKKSYSDVRIVDTAASGLFENRSENLLELL